MKMTMNFEKCQINFTARKTQVNILKYLKKKCYLVTLLFKSRKDSALMNINMCNNFRFSRGREEKHWEKHKKGKEKKLLRRRQTLLEQI